jgi:hypothetical protein
MKLETNTTNNLLLMENDKMITLTEEFLILKTLIRMYDEALKNNSALLMMEIAVDIAESAEKLEQASVDNANVSQ